MICWNVHIVLWLTCVKCPLYNIWCRFYMQWLLKVFAKYVKVIIIHYHIITCMKQMFIVSLSMLLSELWRNDLRCGRTFLLENLKPTPCYAHGLYPCCSDKAWCGNTIEHCECFGCQDYRGKLIYLPYLPYF